MKMYRENYMKIKKCREPEKAFYIFLTVIIVVYFLLYHNYVMGKCLYVFVASINKIVD